jgi:hypothetical protein
MTGGTVCADVSERRALGIIGEKIFVVADVQRFGGTLPATERRTGSAFAAGL